MFRSLELPIARAFSTSLLGGAILMLGLAGATAQETREYTGHRFTTGDPLPDSAFARVSLEQEFDWRAGAATQPDIISHPAARSIQVLFDVDTSLGENSSVTITSGDDGYSQTLTASSLQECANSSVMFNGNEIKVNVDLDPADGDIVQVVVKQLIIGIVPRAQPLEAPSGFELCRERILGRTDAHAMGRIVPRTCTGWIVSNGAHLSAGHCYRPDSPSFGILQFHVPDSNADGSLRHSHPRDQYCINKETLKVSDEPAENSRGDDWAVFEVFPNTETGLLPVQKEQAFYRPSRMTPTDISVLGFAFDRRIKSESFTQRASPQGSLLGEKSETASPEVHLAYHVFAEGGMSGGPIIGTEGSLAFGIHTNECRGGDPAAGTSFNNVKLRDALETFAGPQTVFVDSGHPDTTEDGSIVRPFDTLEEGFKALPPGGILSVVTGVYPVTPGTTIDQSVIQTPVGPITIQ